MPQQLDFFNAIRVNAIMQGVYDPRLQPQPLVWDRRIPDVPAYDDEIYARFIGFPMIADLIADDAAAVVYNFGKFQFVSTRIPKLKVGVGLNESQLRQLNRIRSGGASRDEVGVFNNWENRIISSVRYGVDARREALKIAMLFDGLSYNRLGIILNGVTWGMYSDLKITVGTAWNNTSATPITDIQTARRLARIRYGANYNRVTMSTQSLIYAAATTEFTNQAKTFVPTYLFGGPAPSAPSQNDGYLAQLLGRILSGVPGNDNGGLGPISIELDDRRFFQQASDGSVASTNFWPIAGVALSDSTQDSNGSTWDFANTELQEKVVSDMAMGGAPGVAQLYGPTVYNTLGNLQLNPPGIIYWGAQRGMPRKYNPAANAALTVGSFSDTVATTLPF